MRFVIYGAGAIGGTIGARLHRQGFEVVLIARGEHGNLLATRGLDFIAPDGAHRLRIATVAHPRELEFSADDVVLLCMKSQHTPGALEDLLACGAEDAAIVCAQNGVANERMALRRFERVYAMVVNLPAMHLVPGEVVTQADGIGGILDTGRYPLGSDALVEALTGALQQAGFSAEPDPRVMRKKYAKLLMNINNALQAATELGDATREISRLLRDEALACYAAAGIDCAAAEEVRARNAPGYRVVDLPGRPRGGGSSWQSIARGTGNVEADYLNGEIVLLGRLHGVPTPANRACQALAWRMVRESLPVGHFPVAEVQALIDRFAREVR
ncbi:MAG: 2-dehydropantoate 2-reductase N-terminal domain-containing protein [Pseudomonadales bacterium]